MAGRTHPSSLRPIARTAALQALFLLDVQGDDALHIARKWLEQETSEHPPEVIDYARRCLDGVAKLRSAIDALIARVAVNWDLARIAVADRCIIRLAVFEMTQVEDLPAKVAINEAIELAKRFSTADSSRFVNGILDKLLAGNVKWELATAGLAAPPTPVPPASVQSTHSRMPTPRQ